MNDIKKLLKIIITTLLLCNFFISIYASEVEIPQYNNLYVNDFADILNSEDEKYLINLYQLVENETTAEVVFISIPICSPLEPSEYAQKIGLEWKVGKEDVDNGLIILYCKEENKIWITTGYGLEGILPDSKIGRYLDEYYVPYRDLNNTSEGIIKFSEEIGIILEENKDEIISKNSNNSKLSEKKENLILYLIPTLVIFTMMITQLIHFVNTKKMYNMKYSLDIIFWITVILYYLYGISITIIITFIIYYIMARIFITGNFSNNAGGNLGGGGFGGGSFGGGSFGGGSFGGGGAGR